MALFFYAELLVLTKVWLLTLDFGCGRFDAFVVVAAGPSVGVLHVDLSVGTLVALILGCVSCWHLCVCVSTPIFLF